MDFFSLIFLTTDNVVIVNILALADESDGTSRKIVVVNFDGVIPPLLLSSCNFVSSMITFIIPKLKEVRHDGKSAWANLSVGCQASLSMLQSLSRER